MALSKFHDLSHNHAALWAPPLFFPGPSLKVRRKFCNLQAVEKPERITGRHGNIGEHRILGAQPIRFVNIFCHVFSKKHAGGKSL